MSLALGGFRVCLSITHCAESLQLLSTLKSCESPLTDYSDSTRAVLSPARGALARAGTMLTRAASPSASADGAGRQAPQPVSHCKHDSSHGTRGIVLHSAPWINVVLYVVDTHQRPILCIDGACACAHSSHDSAQYSSRWERRIGANTCIVHCAPCVQSQCDGQRIGPCGRASEWSRSVLKWAVPQQIRHASGCYRLRLARRCFAMQPFGRRCCC